MTHQPSQPSTTTDLADELRNYPAFDPRKTIIAVDPLPDGYCIVPRTSVVQAADAIESLRAQLASAKKALEDIAKEVFADGTPTKAARTARAALKEIKP